MIPTRLLELIKEDLSEIAEKSAVFLDEIQIFKHDIPLSTDDEDEDDKYFPCIVLRAAEGEIKDINDIQNVKCRVFVCSHDNSLDMQGGSDAMQLGESIIQELMAKGNVGGQFRLKFPIKWKMHEETYPYYCFEMELNFETYTVSSNYSNLI